VTGNKSTSLKIFLKLEQPSISSSKFLKTLHLRRKETRQEEVTVGRNKHYLPEKEATLFYCYINL